LRSPPRFSTPAQALPGQGWLLVMFWRLFAAVLFGVFPWSSHKVFMAKDNQKRGKEGKKCVTVGSNS
jgi:hypothetical protein